MYERMMRNVQRTTFFMKRYERRSFFPMKGRPNIRRMKNASSIVILYINDKRLVQ